MATFDTEEMKLIEIRITRKQNFIFFNTVHYTKRSQLQVNK